MLIVGLNKTTLLDYPGRVAAAVFVGGCNFQCPFCHNGEIVFNPLSQPLCAESEILSFLEKRKNILKGVCITGGEPTLHADLPEFAGKVKALGYQVKLDTNGYAPNVLKRLLEEQLLDYVAMDIKNCPEKYAMTVGLAGEGEAEKDAGGKAQFQIERIRESVSVLKESQIDYEFRTTVVRELHDRSDLLKIAHWIKGCPRYFLQQYRDSENVIGSMQLRSGAGKLQRSREACEDFHGYEKNELEELAKAIESVPGMDGKVFIRGMD